MNFHAFQFSPQIVAGITAAGYNDPTPIQSQAIPPVLAGRDVLGLAQTGTGKTAAFVLPILQRLMKGSRSKPRALIVAPTRELAEQIHAVIQVLGRKTGLTSLTVYGGVGSAPQIKGLRHGVDIIVACPGRLLDLCDRGAADLSRIEMMVIDEADRMFDMGFMPDVRRILGKLPKDRQTLLFSATMPGEVRMLTAEILRQPVTVEIGDLKPVDSVSHAVYPADPARKSDMLLELLGKADGQVLVFTRTKHRARKLAQQLVKVGVKAAALQGDMPQSKRQDAMDRFRSGRVRVMVATDIAARGIDVLGISHVINYDMPDTAEAYTHRIGRTGRMARTGEALTLITQDDLPMVRAIERTLEQKIERRELEGFDIAPLIESRDAVQYAYQSSRSGPIIAPRRSRRFSLRAAHAGR